MKKVLLLAVALIVSVCSMWADIAPGTYVIRPYSAQSKCLIPSNVWFRSSDNTVKGPDKVVYTTDDPTSENGGYWVIANATSGGGFTITPENAKFVDTAGQHGYLNPWSGSSNVGCWTSTDGEDRWDFTPVDGKEDVYYIESKSKTGNYLCYNPSSEYLQYLPTASITGEMVYEWKLEKISLINTAKKYYIKNNDAQRYVVLNASGNATISSSDKTPFTFAESGQGFTIKGGTNYLGASGWNALTSNSAFVWTVAKVAEGYTFNQQTTANKGYLGLDATTEGSKLYCNKGASNHYVFSLEEVPMNSYVLTITGQDGAKVTYGGNDYTNGQTINCEGLDASEIEPQAVENYITQVTVGDGTVTVAYYYAKHITDLEQLSNDKAYVLICARGQLTTNGEGLSTTGTPSYAADASKFAIHKHGTNLYLWSIALNGFVNDEQGVATSPYQVLTLTHQSDDTFLGVLNNKGLNMQNNGASIIINDFKTPDPGNKYNIYEVADFAGAADIEACFPSSVDVTYEFYLGGEKIGEKVFTETIGQTPSMTTWFSNLTASNYANITSLHNDPITAESGNAPVQVQTAYRPNMPFKTDGTIYKLDLSNGTYYIYANSSADRAKEATSYVSNNDYKWQIGGNWFTGFTFRNLSGYYIAAPSSAPDNLTNTQVPTELSDKCYFDIAQNGDHGVRFKVHGGTNYLAHTSSTGLNVQFFDYFMRDSQFNVANQINFTEVPAYDWTAFSTKMSQVDVISNHIGTGFGEYADLTYRDEATGTDRNIGDWLENSLRDDWANRVEARYDIDMAAMDYIISNKQLNMPQPGQLFRMKGRSSQKYVYADAASEVSHTTGNIGATNCLPMGDLAGNETTSIFCFDGEHIISYQSPNHTGLYVYQSGLNTNLNDASGLDTFTFAEGPIACTYRIHTAKANSNLYDYHANNGRTNRWSTNDDARICFDLEEVTTLPVTFKATGEGYATIYAPSALEIPTGVTAYVGIEESEGTVKVSPIEDGIIPANTAVVLFKEDVTETTTVDFTISDEAGTAHSCFTGTVPAKASEEGSYVFSIANNTPGFYKFVSSTLAGFKAYYVAAGAPAPEDAEFTVTFNETTVTITPKTYTGEYMVFAINDDDGADSVYYGIEANQEYYKDYLKTGTATISYDGSPYGELDGICPGYPEGICTLYIYKVEGGVAVGEPQTDRFSIDADYHFISTVSPVNGFVLDFGNGVLTGIKGLQTSAPAKAAFDLQGRRVNAATRGLFIQNGVKVIK